MSLRLFYDLKISKLIPIITGLATVLSITLVAITGSPYKDATLFEDTRLAKQNLKLDSLTQQINQLNIINQKKIKDLEANTRGTHVALDNLSSTNSISKLKFYFDQRLDKIQGDLNKRDNLKLVDSLKDRLKALEGALMESPSKAIAVPLLQNELQSLKEAEAKDTADTRASITMIYDQNKWFLGLMFTLAIGMISLAITNYLPKKDKRGNSTNDDDASQLNIPTE